MCSDSRTLALALTTAVGFSAWGSRQLRFQAIGFRGLGFRVKGSLRMRAV